MSQKVLSAEMCICVVTLVLVHSNYGIWTSFGDLSRVEDLNSIFITERRYPYSGNKTLDFVYYS